MDSRNKFGRVGRVGTLGLIGVFALLHACATALTGVVRDADGRAIGVPAGQVNITRVDASSGTSTVVPLKSDGTFRLSEGIAPGTYLVEVLAPGYKITSQKIQVTGSQALEFTLQALPKSKTSVFGTNQDVNPTRGAGGATLTPPQL